ncbi:YbaB/EbfC family nucleoid-associated protein [Solihabitans fulvus]|uniref:YbaB/EbfC family nucleoid-associated protein n=1 Tax=Solihabitans fulvus TaxID=1892852 RepID=A0A5B2XL79_9PSEU|nr:YbaB/EbfC family nucleoid-associated protein [Solihabitans fulvus]KAA2264618.1 YbaB/EbfC family nucleoid-associated protein [Solihabitans fulvus]
MSEPSGLRAELEARNAAMREQVDGLLAELRKKTDELKDTQAKAFAVTADAVSPDGTVRASVDATGVLTKLEFAPSSFERSTPEKLARTATETILQAAGKARAQVSEAFEPLQDGPSIDLSEMLPGLPSMKDLIPPVPPLPQPSAEAPQRRARPADDDEEGGFMERTSW